MGFGGIDVILYTPKEAYSFVSYSWGVYSQDFPPFATNSIAPPREGQLLDVKKEFLHRIMLWEKRLATNNQENNNTSTQPNTDETVEQEHIDVIPGGVTTPTSQQLSNAVNASTAVLTVPDRGHNQLLD